ncbi:hypothetical protein B5F53_14660 [Blautia sp. An249]|uniref:hypothetical protein n=1 Tax=Blautia sp. An249 TaxID=1965603 RepID=UPI000B38334C|nr:hypothetical protein [Blautia sp. An249]OUO77187.1 hypothetical protein B5F53_14660 [Blautia sp. An249]
MQGSFYGEIPMSDEYVAVEAYSVESRASSGSGTEGSYFRGIQVMWTTDESPGGVTNNGWYTGDPNSPFYNYADEEIVANINAAGNADAYFSAWVGNTSINHEAFINNIFGCWRLVY